jgi:hypothetical protein
LKNTFLKTEDAQASVSGAALKNAGSFKPGVARLFHGRHAPPEGREKHVNGPV